MAIEPPDQRRSAPARLLDAGARGAERLAGATGVDKAVEDAVEEAIVRAMRSPAVERAIARGMDEGTIQRAVEDAVERALASDEVADAVIQALDTEVADRVWAEILASPKAQMLVERIAEAPEVRAAITEQGVGMITDLGRRLTAVTERLDDALERIAHRLMRRPPRPRRRPPRSGWSRASRPRPSTWGCCRPRSDQLRPAGLGDPVRVRRPRRLSGLGFLGVGTLGFLIGGLLLARSGRWSARRPGCGC